MSWRPSHLRPSAGMQYTQRKLQRSVTEMRRSSATRPKLSRSVRAILSFTWPMIPTMQYENVLVDREGPVGLVTLNRPRVLNALSPSLIAELTDALGSFDEDPEIGSAVLTGGPRVFAAGADIADMV